MRDPICDVINYRARSCDVDMMLLIMYGYLLRIMWIAKPKYFGFVSYTYLIHAGSV